MTEWEQLRQEILDAAETVSGSRSAADYGYFYFKSSPANIRALIAGYDERLRNARNEALEEAARISDLWNNSVSCDSHDSDPCCHVRTGTEISNRIRILIDRPEEPKPCIGDAK